MTTPPRLVWYAAYGSNMHLDRLDYYLAGGRPPGGRRAYPGCRDSRRPARSVPFMLPGLMYFATESQVWTGGRAFYDPDGEGQLPARAHLLTLGQFSDITAQEMYREPGEDLDLTEVLAHGRARLGPGRYETLVYAGRLDGHPVLTFTAPWRREDVPVNPPAAAYLRHFLAGIVAAHGWSTLRAAEYLASCPGAEGHWTPTEIAGLAAD
ncbi:histone deacetylase [Streptomyces piniterrae]|uniref:Histone deacetylase n=1 Tax=Streptomyces piniterrae TaxID=2571125 RepID=A0A4U0NJM7_9ACTN|nr:histone deacetylase [Streptomyces piniterrae]TJZ54457.1 histone deacetylase [Streptomyces piniterrae]